LVSRVSSGDHPANECARVSTGWTEPANGEVLIKYSERHQARSGFAIALR
jgi:hypothetical protein